MTMLDEKIDELIKEKVEFDEMYDTFLSIEICSNCPTPNECNKCRYFKISYSTNGGENNAA